MMLWARTQEGMVMLQSTILLLGTQTEQRFGNSPCGFQGLCSAVHSDLFSRKAQIPCPSKEAASAAGTEAVNCHLQARRGQSSRAWVAWVAHAAHPLLLGRFPRKWEGAAGDTGTLEDWQFAGPCR